MKCLHLLLPLALLGAGCTTMQPSAIPANEPYVVAVKDVLMDPQMPPISHFAHHTWFDLKEGAEGRWVTIEILGEDTGVVREPILPETARSNVRWTKSVTVLALFQGAVAKAMINQIEKQAAAYSEAKNYEAWPGPNSNTFARSVAEGTPGLHFEFDHNAVGKDYTPWIQLAPTTTGTGLQVDTLPLGLELGLREGVEVHFLQLTLGVSVFPPALKIPFLPRLGFAPGTD